MHIFCCMVKFNILYRNLFINKLIKLFQMYYYYYYYLIIIIIIYYYFNFYKIFFFFKYIFNYTKNGIKKKNIKVGRFIYIYIFIIYEVKQNK